MVSLPVSVATRSYSLPVILRPARVTGAPCHLRNFRFSTATKKLRVARTAFRLIGLQYLFHTIVRSITVIYNASHLTICQFHDLAQLRHPPIQPAQMGRQYAARLHRVVQMC